MSIKTPTRRMSSYMVFEGWLGCTHGHAGYPLVVPNLAMKNQPFFSQLGIISRLSCEQLSVAIRFLHPIV